MEKMRSITTEPPTHTETLMPSMFTNGCAMFRSRYDQRIVWPEKAALLRVENVLFVGLLRGHVPHEQIPVRKRGQRQRQNGKRQMTQPVERIAGASLHDAGRAETGVGGEGSFESRIQA